jgi:hypothetical protein
MDNAENSQGPQPHIEREQRKVPVCALPGIAEKDNRTEDATQGRGQNYQHRVCEDIHSHCKLKFLSSCFTQRPQRAGASLRLAIRSVDSAE